MLLAKHGYYARLDKQLQRKSIEKRYFALVKGRWGLGARGRLFRLYVMWTPLSQDGLPKVEIRPYILQRNKVSYGNIHLVDIRLHTGRTHQDNECIFLISVFLCWEIDLYGGLDDGIQPGLYCHYLVIFYHPF